MRYLDRERILNDFFNREVIEGLSVEDLFKSLIMSYKREENIDKRILRFMDLLSKHKRYYMFSDTGPFLLKLEILATTFLNKKYLKITKNMNIENRYIESMIQYKSIELVIDLFICECIRIKTLLK